MEARFLFRVKDNGLKLLSAMEIKSRAVWFKDEGAVLPPSGLSHEHKQKNLVVEVCCHIALKGLQFSQNVTQLHISPPASDSASHTDSRCA